MIVTEKVLEDSFNYARDQLSIRGLISEGSGLDVVDLSEVYIPSLFGEVGYFFARNTEGLVSLLGFKAGTIYLPNTFGQNVEVTKKS